MPIMMFVGKEDILSTPVDARWTKDQIGDAVIKYTELEDHDHSSFNFGRDMSFMEDVYATIKTMNPMAPLVNENHFLNN